MSKDYTTEKGLHPVSGLKIRRSTAEDVKIVNKPRKMKLVRPTRLPEKTVDFANSSLLVFPTDRLGITTEVKSAMIRAASKMGKDEKNLALLEEVVGILMQHAKARLTQNAESGPLKRRSTPEVGQDQEELSEAPPPESGLIPDVPYEDMQAALKDAGIKPASRTKADIIKAYMELQDKGDE
jgi:hypothetical protein